MNAKLLITRDDELSWTDGSTQPLFTINQETVERVRDFRNTHHGISRELFDQELNATLCGMVERMEREYKGDV